MKSNSERQYEISMFYIEMILASVDKPPLSLSDLSLLLKPPFQAVVDIIHENLEILGEDADAFAETLSFETCFRILEMNGIGHVLLDLLLVSKYLAGEAAVANSMSGIIDVLDREYRIQRISAAYLGGLIYMMMLDID